MGGDSDSEGLHMDVWEEMFGLFGFEGFDGFCCDGIGAQGCKSKEVDSVPGDSIGTVGRGCEDCLNMACRLQFNGMICSGVQGEYGNDDPHLYSFQGLLDFMV